MPLSCPIARLMRRETSDLSSAERGVCLRLAQFQQVFFPSSGMVRSSLLSRLHTPWGYLLLLSVYPMGVCGQEVRLARASSDNRWQHLGDRQLNCKNAKKSALVGTRRDRCKNNGSCWCATRPMHKFRQLLVPMQRNRQLLAQMQRNRQFLRLAGPTTQVSLARGSTTADSFAAR